MAKNNESLNRELYNLLDTRGYNPIPKDSDVKQAGKIVPPEEADVFQFAFKYNGKEIDNVWVTVDGSRSLKVYYDEDIADKTGYRSNTSPYDDSWYGFIGFLKEWARERQLSFDLVTPKKQLDSDMSQRTYMKKKEEIKEGYYSMGKSASYNDNIPSIKIILQHTRQIQEGEQRYRNIAKIFLENTQGERILAPTIKPGIAQVYARHLAEGGVPNDERWNHIKSLCEEYNKMAGFVRAVRGNQFNESALRLVEAGLNHYTNLRETLGKMRGHRGYTTYFESWTPTLMENEGDDNTLNELFVQETLDPRIESVMPILSKLNKNLGEMKQVKELEEWADNLTEAPGAETLAHNKATEKARLDAFDLDEDEINDAEAAKKKINIPAYQRKAKGGDWRVTQQDLAKVPAGTRTTSQGLAAHAKRTGLDGEGVAEGLVGDVVVHNYTKMPIDLKPGQAQIHGWGPGEQPIYRVKGSDGKEVITSNKKKMMMIAQGQGVAEGYEPGDKITWYYSNHYPKIEGTIVGWKDGHLIVQSVDPSPRNTEKTVTKYRVPKNNIMSVEKQGVAEGSSDDDHDYDDGEDRLSGRHGLSADPKKMAVYYPNDPERTRIRTQMNVPNLKKAIKSNLGKHKKPNLPEQGVAEGYSLKKTNVSKYMEPGDTDEYTQDINIKDTDYEIINNKTGQVVGTASWTTNDFMGPGALKITMRNGATRYLDIWASERGNPQTAFNRFVKDPKTSKKYKEQGVAGEFRGELDSKGRFIKDTVQKMFGKLSPDAKDVKEQSVAEGSDQFLVYISVDRVEAFEDWMNSEGLETNVPKTDEGTYVVYDYSNADHTSKMYAGEWNEKKGVAEGSEPKLGTVKANLMNTQQPTVQVQVYKHNTLRGDSYWVTKEVKKFKTMDQAQAYVDRINKQGVAEDLDANQRRVGQLGPTGRPARAGDLVGTNESITHDPLEDLKQLLGK